MPHSRCMYVCVGFVSVHCGAKCVSDLDLHPDGGVFHPRKRAEGGCWCLSPTIHNSSSALGPRLGQILCWFVLFSLNSFSKRERARETGIEEEFCVEWSALLKSVIKTGAERTKGRVDIFILFISPFLTHTRKQGCSNAAKRFCSGKICTKHVVGSI